MAITIASVRQLPGIVEVTGNLATGTVVVSYNSAIMTPEQIIEAIESPGYTVTGTFQP